ncbi:MAG: hypothetical protein IPM82_25275 [Saprospiraceae bacterium]|nr:hypothetical protein [Saprospiraceae bacterium]
MLLATKRSLFIAESGDQVWVAKGAYCPTNQLDRRIASSTFRGKVWQLTSNGNLSRQRPMCKAQKSILSGNISF